MSWNVDFFRRWSPFLTIPSVFRLRALCLRDNGNKLIKDRRIALSVRHPFRSDLVIREWGTDLNILEEIVQEGVYSKVPELIKNCRTIVDLGANIGLATLYLAAQYPEARFVCVEAHPENFSLLSTNLKTLIASGRCAAIEGAVWNRSGVRLSLAAPNPLAFAGVNVSEHQTDGPGPHAVSITMAEILERSGVTTIDLLKVDIEGAETELLSGDISWMENVRAIAIEFHNDSRASSRFDQMMERFGFREIDSTSHTVLVGR